MVIPIAAAILWLWQKHRFNQYLAEVDTQLTTLIDHLQDGETYPEHLAISAFDGTLAALVETRAQLLRQTSEQQRLIKALSQQVQSDPLTGLPNRRALNELLKRLVDNGHTLGILVIRATALRALNDDDGYAVGDQYLKDLAQILKRQTGKRQKPRSFRISGSDFVVLISTGELGELDQFAQHMMAELMALRAQSKEQLPVYIGGALFKDAELGTALSQADTALSLAMAQGQPGWYVDSGLGSNKSLEQRTQQQWREHIQYLLTGQGLTLLAQPVQGINRHQLHYTEILARCHDKEGRLLPTASVMAMAERLGLIQQLDKLVLEKALTELADKPLGQSLYAINLNALSVQDPHFVIWLERRLLANPQLTRSLVFEVPEAGLIRQVGASQRFIELLHKLACRITIERFGTGLGAIRFFKALKPDFVKVDAALSRDIDQDSDGQYYLRILVDIAHRLGVKVLAENVENAEERLVLTELRLDGLQGYFLARPVPFGPRENSQ
ncbi:EAL domain-containing protein [Gallaecimonas mangrovi]|uniref:EAL domain-containing protein n=1 Tax=Gallaecimonas mangrovi TaxID=2291597 RepID=UPI000E203AD3|nr:EAL domain-containing protein [Gallaecimonas mangrovi]